MGGLCHVPVILFPPPEAFMPSMASPFSREGAGAAWRYHVSIPSQCVLRVFPSSYLLAAVDGGVLANAVDLVAGAGVDGVVRLGSVARHDCGFGWLFGC
jgi:hypothetical protein